MSPQMSTVENMVDLSWTSGGCARAAWGLNLARHLVSLLLELPLALLKELTLLLLVLRLILENQALSRLEDLHERLFKRALLIDRH